MVTSPSGLPSVGICGSRRMRSRLETISGSARASETAPDKSTKADMARAEARSPDTVFVIIRSTAETAPRFLCSTAVEQILGEVLVRALDARTRTCPGCADIAVAASCDIRLRAGPTLHEADRIVVRCRR